MEGLGGTQVWIKWASSHAAICFCVYMCVPYVGRKRAGIVHLETYVLLKMVDAIGDGRLKRMQ